jgi:hypothetical protein
MNRKLTASIIALICVADAGPASAYGNDAITCAKATQLVAASPGIETNEILNTINNDWVALDARTVQAGHPPIEPVMVKGNGFFNNVSQQCSLNPGQLLSAAAFQVYRSARAQIDGY